MHLNKRIKNKIFQLSIDLSRIPKGKNKHFSFILDKNKILSIGWNDAWCTHPLSNRLGYRFSAIHSEVSAILRYKGDKQRLKKCILINTRINMLGEFSISKPCSICQNFIKNVGFKRVYFTNHQGVLELL